MTWDSIVDFSVVNRKCKLIACLVCFFYIAVTLFFYLWSSDNIYFAFLRYQQSATWNHTLQTDIPLTIDVQAVHDKSAAVVNDNTTNVTSLGLGKCDETSPLLVGPMHIEFTSPVSLDQVRKMNPDVHTGGRFKPKDCIAVQKVAIIIPFRNRDEHLKYWLYYLHPILQRQQLDYGVYVIDQDGDGVFNRAKLFNVGYSEALKLYDYECFVFSDVDLVPMDDRNIYKCFSQPRHLSVSLDKFGFRLPYPQIFGGLSALSKEQFLKINGFPNNYWGWGGEDDDMYNRLTFKGMSISRPDGVIGRCRMIHHGPDKQNEPNPQRFDRIAHTRETMHIDGINSLSYKVVKVEKDQLYTKITVDVGTP